MSDKRLLVGRTLRVQKLALSTLSGQCKQTVALKYIIQSRYVTEAFSLLRAKRGLYLGSSRSVASGCISCMHLNFGSYSLSDSGHIAWCNDVKRHGLPQGEHARPIKSTVQLVN